MNLIDKLSSFELMTNEKDWLQGLRQHVEDWYNELTTPVLPILKNKKLHKDTNEYIKYKQIAEELLNHAYISNAGNKLSNLFDEMNEKNLLINSKVIITPLIHNYIDTGMFLKEIAYNYDPEIVHKKWKEFEENKNKLIIKINSQIQLIL